MNNRTIERFKEYHYKNPHVFELVVQYAKEAREKGFKHYTIAGIFEIIRWHTTIKTSSDDNFKISNNYKPLYVRLLEHKYPEFKGFFITKQLKNR